MDDTNTSWGLLRNAAEGVPAERERFCLTYGPIIHEFLGRRWRSHALAQELDDAEQETLFECFRKKGVIDQAVSGIKGGFRAFLYGVTMNVAKRFEERRGKKRSRESSEAGGDALDDFLGSDPEREFNQAWAASVVSRARDSMQSGTTRTPEEAQYHCDILRMRFFEDLPIRTIAAKLGKAPAQVHHDYAKARIDFRDALHEVVRFESPGAKIDIDNEVHFLLANLE